MRGVVVALVALVAAFAGPIRQACGASCVGEAAPRQQVMSTIGGSCHRPEQPPEPAPEPARDHCTHDHSSTLRPSSRTSLVEVTLEPALFEAPARTAVTLIRAAAPTQPAHLPPGWPPIRIVPLRI